MNAKLEGPARPAISDFSQHVRAAAAELVAALQVAERATHAWSNERLSDALVEGALSTCMHRLAQTNLWGRDNQIPSGEFWNIAGPLLEVGSLQWHARAKPRGYAGDYLMLTRICEQDCSPHPLGRAFDRFFQSQAAVAAVRARTEHIAAALAAHRIAHRDKQYRVVSVGSGPAIDVEQALAALPPDDRRGMWVTLLDLDDEALTAAHERLKPLLPESQIQCVRDNLYRLPDKPRSAAPLAGSDFLICSGLFDYLPDESAAAMLRLFWNSMSPAGRVLVGNFAPHCPTRAFMEWIGNWYLLYRTPADLQQLAAVAGIPDKSYEIGAERLGIDLFLRASRSPSGRG